MIKKKQVDLGDIKLKEILNLISEQSIQFYENIVETIRDPLMVLDSDLRVLFANRRFYDEFKVTEKETVNNRIYDLGNKQWNIPRLRVLLEEILPKKNRFNDFRIRHNFQSIGKRIMLLNARRITNLPGEQQLILLVIEDVTDRMINEQALQVSEERFRRAFETARDGVLLINKTSGKILISNQAAQNLLGYPIEEMLERKLWEMGFISDTKQFRKLVDQLEEEGFFTLMDVAVKTREGRKISADIYLTNGAKLIQCNIRDITDRKIEEEEIRYIGIHDILTKIYNRTFFEAEISRLEKSRLFPVSIFMIDVDRLKITNDTQGHAKGDELLIRTAQILLDSFRVEDIVARIGGDEFAVILPETNEKASLLALKRINHFLKLNNKNYKDNELKISIGIATLEKQGSLAKTLKCADDLMYLNKRSKERFLDKI